jgi:threonine aldolase
MNFRSDNTAPVAAEIMAALVQANEGAAAAYGDDAWSRRLGEAFSDLFEHDVRVFTAASGTAANAIALASVAPPWGAILCHREAHIERDECGAPEFYSGGAKLILADGDLAKLSVASVESAMRRLGRDVHAVKPAALSISQATERSAVYTPDEVAALGAMARREGWALHVDGARFANAVAALGCKASELTWRAGVDLLSFGATKNGAMGAEAIIAFDPRLADQIERRRKRGGHLLCKGRYPAAQLLAYLEGGLWLRLAQRANDLARKLGEAGSAHLSAPVATNQIFIKPGEAALAKLRAAGADFYDWGEAGSGEARLVVSWNQDEAEVDAMCALLRSLK